MAAGKLGEEVSPHLPFWVGAAAVLAGGMLLVVARSAFAHIDLEHLQAPDLGSTEQAADLTLADS